jgi:hypothetical protein
VGRIVLDLHVHHRGQATETLGADAQAVHRVHDLQAQFLDPIGRPAPAQIIDVDGVHEGLLGEHRGLLRGTADADTQHPRRTPAGTHGRQRLHHPVDDGIRRVEHRQLGLVLGAAALGRHAHVHRIAGHHLHVDHRRRVVAGVAACPCGIVEYRGAQHVVRVRVGAAHALVDHLRDRQLASQRTSMPIFRNTVTIPVSWQIGRWPSAHMRELMRICAIASFAAGLTLHLPGAVHGLHIVQRVVVGDELQRVGHAVYEIILADHGHRRCPRFG